MNDKPIRYSIVIPCYNERDRLPATLRSVIAHLQARRPSSEIVVVDDGSSDGTSDWVRSQTFGTIPIQVIAYSPNRGKGYAVKTGMLAARGDYVLFMDADGATRIEEAEKMWPRLESGQADVVIGSRAMKSSHILIFQSPLRRLAGDLYGMLARLLVLRGIVDTQCGFKAFTRAAAQAIFSRQTITSAIFDIEILILATKQRWRVCELPVVWRHDNDTRIAYNFRKSLLIFAELLKLKARHHILWPLTIRQLRPTNVTL